MRKRAQVGAMGPLRNDGSLEICLVNNMTSRDVLTVLADSWKILNVGSNNNKLVGGSSALTSQVMCHSLL